MTRRDWLGLLSALGFGGTAAAQATAAAPQAPKIEPLLLTAAQWKQRLTPAQFHVLREPAEWGKAQGHLPLRRLRPAAVLERDEVRERDRLAELLRTVAGRGGHQA
jgi:hypothetical protein